jgi:hypothetical protein
MFDSQDLNHLSTEGDMAPLNGAATDQVSPPTESAKVLVPVEAAPVGNEALNPVPDTTNGDARGRRSEAGRKGAYRIHQLIREGKLYEQEHGLKRGRQRLRQLIEQGKVYEAEHGMHSPRTKARTERLSRLDREDVMATLLFCLVRLAKSSFRGKLLELSERLRDVPQEDA